MNKAIRSVRRRRLVSAVAALVMLAFVPYPARADEETSEAQAILSKMRVLAFNNVAKNSTRVVLVRLDRKDQMIVSEGQEFEPEAGLFLTVKKVNEDGSVFVTGSGITLGRIRVATDTEKKKWLEKLRTGAFDS